MARHIRNLTRTTGPVIAQNGMAQKIDANDLNFVSTVLIAVEAKKLRAQTEDSEEEAAAE